MKDEKKYVREWALLVKGQHIMNPEVMCREIREAYIKDGYQLVAVREIV